MAVRYCKGLIKLIGVFGRKEGSEVGFEEREGSGLDFHVRVAKLVSSYPLANWYCLGDGVQRRVLLAGKVKPSLCALLCSAREVQQSRYNSRGTTVEVRRRLVSRTKYYG